jgi:thioredoxin-related protein
MISAFFVASAMFAGFDAQTTITHFNGAETAPDSVVWMPLEEVNKVVEKNIKKNKAKEQKLIIVDFYTDWCGWCKKLDNETYNNAEVAALMNTYFYPVKFDAEQKDSVAFAGVNYKFKPSGSRGTNEFALTMASRPGGRIGYPTITIISPMGEKIAVEAGFKNAEKMKLFLLYYGEGHYLTKDYLTFEKEYNQKQLTD